MKCPSCCDNHSEVSSTINGLGFLHTFSSRFLLSQFSFLALLITLQLSFRFSSYFYRVRCVYIFHAVMLHKESSPIGQKTFKMNWIFFALNLNISAFGILSLQCPVEARPVYRCLKRLQSACWSAGYLPTLMSSSIVCPTLRWLEQKARTALWVNFTSSAALFFIIPKRMMYVLFVHHTTWPTKKWIMEIIFLLWVTENSNNSLLAL